MMVGAPLALDSYWGLALVAPGFVALAVRIDDEETMLREEFTGYDDYVQRVRFRVVPGVW